MKRCKPATCPFSGTMGFVLFLLASVCASCGSQERGELGLESKKPNLLFILTDDQRWDALGFAGNDIIHTPEMDALAGQGLYFDNAFVTTAICAASRASLFTGLYERTHDFTFGKPPLQEAYLRQSYPWLLKNAGYRTGFIGKFGVKVNPGMEDSLFNQMDKTSWPYLREVEGKEVHLADINGDRAVEFIRTAGEQPFCLSLSFWSPHADDGAVEQYFWPEYVDHLYREASIPVPPTADPSFFDGLPEVLQHTLNRERWYWRYDTPDKFQEMVKGYYRMISTVDAVLGRIRRTLEEEGLADNTVIVFMGDNGYFMGERGYAGKWLLHEPSIRVPLMVYDPRQPENNRGKRYTQPVLNVDVTPTLLSLAGVQIPDSYAGRSLTEFYTGAPEDWRRGVFLEHRLENNPKLLKTEGYRDEAYKFIRYDDSDLIELYHHKTDVHEVNNLALDEAYAGLITQYSTTCDSIIQQLMHKRVINR